MRRRRRRNSGARRGLARRLADLALTLIVLAALALVAARVPTLLQDGTLHGPARVADGDSLVVGGARVRLLGIDAPELAQTCVSEGRDHACGQEARAHLARLAVTGAVSCETFGRDRYDRVLARCMAGAIELNRAMVGAGWAVAYGDYDDAEAEARRAGRGLWAGSFERPQDWRRSHDGFAETPHGGFSGIRGWLRALFGL